MKYLSRRFRVVVVGVGLLCASSVVDAATIKVRAVRLNGAALPAPASTLDVNRGDRIEVDILAGGWGSAFNNVKTYQATLNIGAMLNLEGPEACGSILPINFDTLELRPTGAFINNGTTGRGVCAAGATNAGASCVIAPVLCSGGVCVDGMCQGGSAAGSLCATATNQCVGGSCIPRPDYIFDGFSNPICAVSTFATNYPMGCTLFLDNGPSDGGGDYYLGTAVLEVRNDAAGTFVFDVVPPPSTFLTDPNRLDAPIESEALTLNVIGGSCVQRGACCMGFNDCQEPMSEADCGSAGGIYGGDNTTCAGLPDFCGCPSIESSVPANCSVDARYPFTPGGSPVLDKIGFTTVEVTLTPGTNMDFVDASSFQLSHVGGGVFNPPLITAVTPLGGTTVRIDFDKPFQPQRWSCLGMTCAGVNAKDICLGHLPADVDGGCTANAPDILVLIDFLNGLVPLEWYQCDVDASDACNPADVLAVIDLLNGASGFQSYNNVQCAGGACPTAP